MIVRYALDCGTRVLAPRKRGELAPIMRSYLEARASGPRGRGLGGLGARASGPHGAVRGWPPSFGASAHHRGRVWNPPLPCGDRYDR